MNKSLRILITGFGPFPGAPHNPTMPLVARLLRLRRPAFSEVEFSGHIFPVTYKAVDRELPQLLAQHRPHALLMFCTALVAYFAFHYKYRWLWVPAFAGTTWRGQSATPSGRPPASADRPWQTPPSPRSAP